MCLVFAVRFIAGERLTSSLKHPDGLWGSIQAPSEWAPVAFNPGLKWPGRVFVLNGGLDTTYKLSKLTDKPIPQAVRFKE